MVPNNVVSGLFEVQRHQLDTESDYIFCECKIEKKFFLCVKCNENFNNSTWVGRSLVGI